jgi:hypothetical protein
LHDILIIVWIGIKLMMGEIEQARWWCVDRHEDGTFDFDNIDYHVDLVVRLKVDQFYWLKFTQIMPHVSPNDTKILSTWHITNLIGRKLNSQKLLGLVQKNLPNHNGAYKTTCPYWQEAFWVLDI